MLSLLSITFSKVSTNSVFKVGISYLIDASVSLVLNSLSINLNCDAAAIFAGSSIKTCIPSEGRSCDFRIRSSVSLGLPIKFNSKPFKSRGPFPETFSEVTRSFAVHTPTDSNCSKTPFSESVDEEKLKLFSVELVIFRSLLGPSWTLRLVPNASFKNLFILFLIASVLPPNPASTL